MKIRILLKTALITLIILLITLSGCIGIDLNPEHHQFVYDTESINIAIDRYNNIHLSWQEIVDDEIAVYYTKLDSDGSTIINDKKIYSEKISKTLYRDPDIAIDSNNNVHIIFSVNNNILYTKLNEDGNNEIEPIQITDNNSSTDGDFIIDSSDNLHLVWVDWRSGKAQIFYIKLSKMGEKITEEKKISQNNSYDPSIIMDSEENIFVCWYFEWVTFGFWTEIGHRQISYIEMNKNGEILKRTNLDILGKNYKQSSVEMCINSKDQIGIVWTLNNKLKYFSLETLTREKKEIESINKKFNLDTNYLYDLNLNEFKPYQIYFIEINLTKEEFGRSSGEIFINRNESDFVKLDSWSFGVIERSNILTLEYDVTNYILSNGSYKIKFIKNSGIADLEIKSIRLFSIPLEIKENVSCTLSSRVVFEPAVDVDPDNNNNFVWYDSNNNNSELHYLRTDHKGNIIFNKKQITFENGRSYDPAIKIDNKGYIYIVWLDDRTEDEAIYFMKLDQNSNKIINDIRISDERKLEEVTDDGLLEISALGILIFALPIIGIIIVIYIIYSITKKKK
jgi:hypothetical protein